MKIALVSNTLTPPGHGGAEACVVALAQHLRHAHDVVVFSGAATQLEGVRCVQIPALEPVAPEANLLRKVVMHARDQWMWSVHRSLRQHLAEERVDVVNTHEVQGLSSAAFTAVASLGLPHVHTAHDPNILCTRILMARGGEYCGGRCFSCRPQRLIRGHAAGARLDAFIAPSDNLREVHVAAGVVPADRALTIRQGVSPGKKRLRAPDPDGLRVGFIGRLAAHKGLPTLLRALPLFPDGWRLVIAGSGPLERSLVAAACSDRRIDYRGYVEQQDKEDFFDSLDILVIPSEWEEPAPLVAAEAAVRGIPCVVSDRGGLSEIPLCRVFHAGSAESLSQTINRFLEDCGLARASRALLVANDRFLFSRYAQEVERVLVMAARRRLGYGDRSGIDSDSPLRVSSGADEVGQTTTGRSPA